MASLTGFILGGTACQRTLALERIARCGHQGILNFRCSRKSTQRWSRNIHLMEDRANSLLQKFEASTVKGHVATNVSETVEIAKRLLEGPHSDMVVKALVSAGGRGKGHFKENGLQGGVHVVHSVKQAESLAKQMLGKHLVTAQTTSEGLLCRELYLCERIYARKEFYHSYLLDRETGGPMLLLSGRGGVSIEDLAHNNPDALVKLNAKNNDFSLTEELAEKLELSGFDDGVRKAFEEHVKRTWHLFMKSDCLMLEINPLTLTSDNRLVAADCKLEIDDSAKYRQAVVQKSALLEMSECERLLGEKVTLHDGVDVREVFAAECGLNYVALPGSIGCLINGAGLALATMDTLAYCGGTAANFLDVGGGATGSQIFEALRLLHMDSQVRVIFINIFGGIVRCDAIAAEISAAVERLHLAKPIVLRLVGTNASQAHEIIGKLSHKSCFQVGDLHQGAKLATALDDIMRRADSAKLQLSVSALH